MIRFYATIALLLLPMGAFAQAGTTKPLAPSRTSPTVFPTSMPKPTLLSPTPFNIPDAPIPLQKPNALPTAPPAPSAMPTSPPIDTETSQRINKFFQQFETQLCTAIGVVGNIIARERELQTILRDLCASTSRAGYMNCVSETRPPPSYDPNNCGKRTNPYDVRKCYCKKEEDMINEEVCNDISGWAVYYAAECKNTSFNPFYNPPTILPEDRL